MILWLLAACTGGAELQPADPDPFHDGIPAIETIDWACDPEANEWTFEIRTENWTGGGWIWMGKSESNAEGHRIKSVEAAADGTTDRLKLSLDIEEDWRDASRSSSTRWLCSDTPQLSFLSTVYGPRGDEVEDCRTWGLQPQLWSRVESAHECEEVLDMPESQDTSEPDDTADRR
jgi:hypothetical protein